MNPKKAKEIQKSKKEARKLKENQHIHRKTYMQILAEVRAYNPQKPFMECQKIASEMYLYQKNA